MTCLRHLWFVATLLAILLLAPPTRTGVPRTDHDWWSQVQRGLARDEYRPGRDQNGLQAPNRAHNLRTYFDATGIRVHDRAAPGGPRLVSMSLIGFGDGVVHHAGSRVEIRRRGIVEWYENSPDGVEQGFTVAARSQGADALVLEFAVEHARARQDRDAIELTTGTGRRLRYGKLFAEDSRGRALGSRLEVASPHRVR